MNPSSSMRREIATGQVAIVVDRLASAGAASPKYAGEHTGAAHLQFAVIRQATSQPGRAGRPCRKRNRSGRLMATGMMFSLMP